MTSVEQVDSLRQIQQESEQQALPQQEKVFAVAKRVRTRLLHNLPDPTHPPLGWVKGRGFDEVFPFIRLPELRPALNGDQVQFGSSELEPNRLYFGDNLQVLRTLPSESIDLIYIDPPFFSGADYNTIWGDANEVRTFNDIWEGGIDTYLVWLNARLWEMRRVLKSSGSIYVHCDWHASHYIKAEMDKIFGYDHFRNGVIWRRSQTRSSISKIYKRAHDALFFYTKSSDYLFQMQYKDLSDASKDLYGAEDEKGFYRLVPLVVSGIRRGETGQVWRGIDPNTCGKSGSHWVTVPSKLEAYEGQGLIVWPKKKGGLPQLKYYLEDNKGVPVTDLWDDIDVIPSSSAEAIGYPTQKPEALLDRIIKASSVENAVVADFFCGGGTTPVAAQRHNRRWIACDISRVAVSVTLDRLVKICEEQSGVKSNYSKPGEVGFQPKITGLGEKVPDIRVVYVGVYPMDRFKAVDEDQFEQFILQCFDASLNTQDGAITGFRNQLEPILVGPADPDAAPDAKLVKEFFEECLKRLQPNARLKARVIAWKFSPQLNEYRKTLLAWIAKNLPEKNVAMEFDYVPINSQQFRERILKKYPDADDNEFFMRFTNPPIIGGNSSATCNAGVG